MKLLDSQHPVFLCIFGCVFMWMSHRQLMKTTLYCVSFNSSDSTMLCNLTVNKGQNQDKTSKHAHKTHVTNSPRTRLHLKLKTCHACFNIWVGIKG